MNRIREAQIRRVARVAVLLTASLALSCGDETTSPCPQVTGAAGIRLVSHGHELYRQDGATQQGAITVAPGGLVHAIECTFLDAQGRAIAIANDCQADSLTVVSLNPAIAVVSRDAGLRFFFNVSGETIGQTTLDLQLLQDSAARFTALPIPVVVPGAIP